MITVTFEDSQNRFGQLLGTFQRKLVIITLYGRTAAFMVSPQDMQDMQALQTARDSKRQSAVVAFETWSQRAAASALQRRPC